jgi:hypothetical protein
MKKYMALLILAAALVSSLDACKKKEKEEEYDNSSAPKSNAIIENAYDEMTNMSDQAVNGTLDYYGFPKVTTVYGKEDVSLLEKEACNVIITIDTVSSPKTVTIDWGNANCDCDDGKQRRGKIITSFTGKYRDSGTVITHTPVDYYVNDNKISGTKTVTNKGLNSSGKPYFTISVNGTVTMSDGEIFTYTSDRVRTWTAGHGTLLYFLDDEYDITGSANASSTNGNGYVATITSALHVKVGCPYIMSGILEFTPTGKLMRTINYGNGTCDNTFTVTINGVTYTING